MSKLLLLFLCSIFALIGCKESEEPIIPEDILGFNLLNDIVGHWVGENDTPFGNYDWFAFDFRPISASHVHSIYEGATQQNIITSFFVADFEGRQQIMARNGGWLYGQYRATYFVLDKAEQTSNGTYYRLVDAVGRENRAFIELRFENGTLRFDAYKDNSGTLDEPIHHMGFVGENYNPSFAQNALNQFEFPQRISEVNLNNAFTDLVDPDTAMFLEESDDPFPKDNHGHISELTISIEKDPSIEASPLLLYISKEPIVSETGQVDFDNLETKLIRTIDIAGDESSYKATYLHPDTYYITAFSDSDENFYPSAGEYTCFSQQISVQAESQSFISLSIDEVLP